MKRKILFLIIQIILLFLVVETAFASESVSESSALIKVETQNVSSVDIRVVQLERFLESHGSPLSPQARVFVEKADEYQLPDWKLVPAIAGVESSFGKAMSRYTYNAYGWNNGKYTFKSNEEAIDTVSFALKNKYIDRGADTVDEIARIYAPPSKTWSSKVKFYMRAIENFNKVELEDLTLTI